MQIFGSTCYAYDSNVSGKLEARGTKGIFVGYDKTSPAYLVYFPENGSVKRMRCVKFAKECYLSQTEYCDDS